MLKGFFNVPKAVNEPVKSYAPGSPERAKVAETYKAMWNSQVEVPLYIGSEEIKTGDTKKMSAPHRGRKLHLLFRLLTFFPYWCHERLFQHGQLYLNQKL